MRIHYEFVNPIESTKALEEYRKLIEEHRTIAWPTFTIDHVEINPSNLDESYIYLKLVKKENH